MSGDGCLSMGGKTITRADLAEAVFRKVGLSRTESASLVEMVIDEVCNAIVRGESVKLSSFATFQIRDKNERIGRNPKTGEEVPISPRRVMGLGLSISAAILKDHGGQMKYANRPGGGAIFTMELLTANYNGEDMSFRFKMISGNLPETSVNVAVFIDTNVWSDVNVTKAAEN